jgi:PAS domain S-box-containing protein
MNLKNKSWGYWLGGGLSAMLVFALGLHLLVSTGPFAHSLEWMSYNYSFDLGLFASPDVKSSGVVIVFIDEKSFKDLDQPQNQSLDRKFQADLLNRMKQDQAKAVVMDIIFSDPGPQDRLASDAKFTEALRANGHVVLGVDYNRSDEDNVRPFMNTASTLLTTRAMDKILTFPYEPFRKAAAGLGLVQLTPDQDFVIRKHFKELSSDDLARIVKEERGNVPESLSMVTAQMLGLPVAKAASRYSGDRWIYYYGRPGEAIPGVSFSEAFTMPPGFFKDKIVFVGARPKTGEWSEVRDEMRSPFSTFGWHFTKMPMVEIHATEFLNLLRRDWLTRPSLTVEAGILLIVGIVFGFGLLSFRPVVATGAAAIGTLVVLLAAQTLFAVQHIWFAWMIIVGAQIPCALLYAIIFEQAALLDKAGDAIIVHDLDWRAQYWNKSAEALYGWNFAEVQALSLKTDVFKTDEAKLLEALQTALAKGEWSGELKQSSKTGRALLVQSRWTLVRDDAGKPKSVLVINTDVTEQKKLELQFLRTQRMESIGTLAGGIAHDLNNVLAPILMGVEMMKMKSTDEFTTKMLTTMSSSAKRGSDMVKQVLTFARGHEGERSVLQISHLVREMQKIVKETFPKSIDFSTELGDNLWPIMGDATQIHQIILNLCVNARDAMPDGGKLALGAKNVALTEEQAAKFAGAKAIQYVLLSSSDSGTGIPPEIIEKIFEPFFTTKEIGKGTGLGLSTVISIIKSHGGFLDLQTQVGKGTTFNVYLPAAESALQAAPAPISPDALRGKGETVMLVDDEPGVLEVTKHMLTHYGYNVITAIHGADALALYPQCKARLGVVIMDMMMPVMDGPNAIRELRKQDPKLKFIAISGLLAGDKIQERIGGEEVAFISKPFASEKLLVSLREVLNEAPKPEAVAAGV